MSAEPDQPWQRLRRLADRRPGVPPIWPLLLIAAPAAVAVWSGWVGLGQLCGFGVIHPLPGIWDAARLNTAITLPVGVEAYGAYALTAWLRPGVPKKVRRFAMWSALGSLGLGMAGQGVFHLLSAEHFTRAPAAIVVLVACLPVVSLGLGTSLAHMLRAEGAAEQAADGPAAGAIEGAMPGSADGPRPRAMNGPAEGPAAGAGDGPQPGPAVGPEPGPRPEPRERVSRPSKDPEAERARRAYRKSAREGDPLTDRALGAMFERSRNWGASRIAEVRSAPPLAEAR